MVITLLPDQESSIVQTFIATAQGATLNLRTQLTQLRSLGQLGQLGPEI